jgi:hypothetical protein
MNDDAKLGEQTAYLAALRSPDFHNPLSGTMRRKNRLLLNVFDRHRTHIGSAYRFANRFRICHIMPVSLDVRFDELGDISLTVCPNSPSFLAQWCETPQASMPIRQGSSLAKRPSCCGVTAYAARPYHAHLHCGSETLILPNQYLLL